MIDLHQLFAKVEKIAIGLVKLFTPVAGSLGSGTLAQMAFRYCVAGAEVCRIDAVARSSTTAIGVKGDAYRISIDHFADRPSVPCR